MNKNIKTLFFHLVHHKTFVTSFHHSPDPTSLRSALRTPSTASWLTPSPPLVFPTSPSPSSSSSFESSQSSQSLSPSSSSQSASSTPSPPTFGVLSGVVIVVPCEDQVTNRSLLVIYDRRYGDVASLQPSLVVSFLIQSHLPPLTPDVNAHAPIYIPAPQSLLAPDRLERLEQNGGRRSRTTRCNVGYGLQKSLHLQ